MKRRVCANDRGRPLGKETTNSVGKAANVWILRDKVDDFGVQFQKNSRWSPPLSLTANAYYVIHLGGKTEPTQIKVNMFLSTITLLPDVLFKCVELVPSPFLYQHKEPQ